jgi:hypothetical protein
MKVEYVPTNFVHQQWDTVAKFLADALNQGGSAEMTLDQLRADLGQNRASLYKVTKEGFIIGATSVVFQNQRNARVAFINAMGGEWIATDEGFEQFKTLLKSAGATHVAAAGRDSIVRLSEKFGLKKKYTVFEAAL